MIGYGNHAPFMATNITEPEILAFLRSIESGEVRLTPLEEPQEVYAGCVPYTASNGWKLVIFNDANEWDYIEQIRTADGRECSYDDIYESMPTVDAYEPSIDVSWTRYGIPGYCKRRCVRCGRFIDRKSSSTSPHVCRECEQQKADQA